MTYFIQHKESKKLWSNFYGWVCDTFRADKYTQEQRDNSFSYVPECGEFIPAE